MVSIADSLARGKVPYEVFSGREANLRYPHQLKIPDTYTCVYEDGGGSLNAQKSVMAFQVPRQIIELPHVYNIYSLLHCDMVPLCHSRPRLAMVYSAIKLQTQ